MAEGAGDDRPAVAAGPDAIRHEMARTRAALTAGLDALRRRLFGTNPPPNPGARTIMVAKKKPATAKVTKSEAASKLASGPKKAPAKKSASAAGGGTASKAKAGTASKAKAGSTAKASAGAKSKGGSGAAAKNSRSTAARKKPARTTGVTTKTMEVLGDVAAGAAVGALAGAAQAAVEALGQDGKQYGGEAEVRVGTTAEAKKTKGGK